MKTPTVVHGHLVGTPTEIAEGMVALAGDMPDETAIHLLGTMSLRLTRSSLEHLYARLSEAGLIKGTLDDAEKVRAFDLLALWLPEFALAIEVIETAVQARTDAVIANTPGIEHRDPTPDKAGEMH